MLERSTYYILDAQGQQLSMYEHIVDNSEVKYHLTERNLYGSSRLGTLKGSADMYAPDLLPSYGVFGNRNYELSNHLGNVLSVITDFVAPIDEDLDEEVDSYQVSLAMTSDYSPFGVQLDGRTFDNVDSRYGFNNMERDDELKGSGNSYDFGARFYDSRLGRWLSIDPLAEKYPHLNPYNFVANNPLYYKDPDGEKIIIYYDSGEKDDNNNPILKPYEYGSGLKVPKDKFVKQVIRTLNKIERKGKDPNGIISTLKNSETANSGIVQRSKWSLVSANLLFSQITYKTDDSDEIHKIEGATEDLILWHPNSGYISKDGKVTQSAANTLLHELGHTYYATFDPDGVEKELQDIYLIVDFEEMQSKLSEFENKYEMDTYHEPSDRWIIQNVEDKFGEGKRDTHSGNILKTNRIFSRRGKQYATSAGEIGNVKDLKKL